MANSIKIIKKDLYIYRKNHAKSLMQNKKKADISPIITAYEVEQFLRGNLICETLYKKIMSKYILKALSWYGKTSSGYKNIYFEKLQTLFDFTKHLPVKYWWNHYKLEQKDSYFDSKIKYLKAFLQYYLKFYFRRKND